MSEIELVAARNVYVTCLRGMSDHAQLRPFAKSQSNQDLNPDYEFLY